MEEYRNPGVMTMSGNIISQQKGFDISVFDPGLLKYVHFGVIAYRGKACDVAKKISRKRHIHVRVQERRGGMNVAVYNDGKKMKYR